MDSPTVHSPSPTCVRRTSSEGGPLLVHTWLIDKFSKRYDRNQSDDSLQSAEFALVNIQFSLLLEPHGSSDKSKDYVSLYLCYDSPCEQIKLACTLSIIDANNQKQNTKGIAPNLHCLLPFNSPPFLLGIIIVDEQDASSKGFSEFILRDYLFDPASYLLFNDTLTIQCEVMAS